MFNSRINHSDDSRHDSRVPGPGFGHAAAYNIFYGGVEQHSNLSTTSTEDIEKEKTTFADRVRDARDHVKMGPKLSETVKGKLQLGARIIQKGGRENIFKEVFGESKGEKLLKASQCYLSTTTAGPIVGILFISTQKVAFCSDRSIITLRLPNGDLIQKPYKLVIPTNRIKEANRRENAQNPPQKYIHILTYDSFDFEHWFMGFIRYEKAFHNLRKALSSVPN